MKNRNLALLSGTATALVASLAATPALSADDNPFQMREIQRPATANQKLAQGRCGGRCGGNWEGRCGGSWEGRCGGRMMGGAMPRAPKPAQLPESDSTGARLVTQYCTQCHGLPNPKQHGAAGWPATVARMNARMQWMSQANNPMNIVAPTREELRTLTAYLEENAADAEATAVPDGPRGLRSGRERSSSIQNTPVDILRYRYARGEIEREDFMRRLEDLNRN